MIKLGEINYNPLANNWLNRYPDLQNGQISFLFNHGGKNYNIRIYYNSQAEHLFYDILNINGNKLQSQCFLAEHPIDLIFCGELREVSLYYKNQAIYFGVKGEELAVL